MVKICEAEAYLRSQIPAYSLDVIDIEGVWEVFKSFGREHIDGADEVELWVECS